MHYADASKEKEQEMDVKGVSDVVETAALPISLSHFQP